MAAAAQPHRAYSQPAAVPRKTVLLVEDQAEVRDVTTLLLKSLGFDVLEAGSAEAALALAHSTREIHLLMTDLHLPDMEGEVLADCFALLRPQAPILFVSGSAECDLPEHSLGPQRKFLGKPFVLAELRQAAKELLD